MIPEELFFEIARIAAIKKPKYLLSENVPGLLSHNGGRTFATILGTLDELGYDVVWEVLNSANFGVAQSRKECSLSDFIEKSVPEKYCLSQTQIQKLLSKEFPERKETGVYSVEGLSITLTSQAGGFGGKTGLYEILGLPIKVKPKQAIRLPCRATA